MTKILLNFEGPLKRQLNNPRSQPAAKSLLTGNSFHCRLFGVPAKKGVDPHSAVGDTTWRALSRNHTPQWGNGLWTFSVSAQFFKWLPKPNYCPCSQNIQCLCQALNTRPPNSGDLVSHFFLDFFWWIWFDVCLWQRHQAITPSFPYRILVNWSCFPSDLIRGVNGLEI